MFWWLMMRIDINTKSNFRILGDSCKFFETIISDWIFKDVIIISNTIFIINVPRMISSEDDIAGSLIITIEIYFEYIFINFNWIFV